MVVPIAHTLDCVKQLRSIFSARAQALVEVALAPLQRLWSLVVPTKGFHVQGLQIDEPPFEAAITQDTSRLVGPWREPKQMLGEQSYDDHSSIHDDATAKSLGFQGGTIEGPTHFSQFAPLAFATWGQRWIEAGCLSVHYRTPVYEGERVRAILEAPGADGIAIVRMEKEDGSEVLVGTAAITPLQAATELDRRLADLRGLDEPVVLANVAIGTRTARKRIAMGMDQHMGHLYPFTLAQKLLRITEPSPWYRGEASPYSRPIIPMEMVSVLMSHAADDTSFYTRGPVVGLFADQEIRLIAGPLFVDEPYEIDREVVGISGSKRTESIWVLTRLYAPGSSTVIATMLLNLAILKESFAGYAADHSALYPKRDL